LSFAGDRFREVPALPASGSPWESIAAEGLEPCPDKRFGDLLQEVGLIVCPPSKSSVVLGIM